MATIAFPEFQFVDLAVGGVDRRNNPVPITEVRGKVNGEVTDAYITIHRFGDDFRQWVERTGSVSKFAGASMADYVVFDIDCRDEAGEPDLKAALRATLALIHTLHETYGVGYEQVRIFFSGSKGFHILVPIQLFGDVAPSEELHDLLKHVALEIATEAGVEVDRKIYDKTRLFRLPNTRHSGSGLFKVELTHDELTRLDAEEIRALATGPRLTSTWAPHDLDPVAALQALLERIAEKPPTTNGSREGKSAETGASDGTIKEGHRDDHLTSLAGSMRKRGMTPEAIEAALQVENEQRCRPPLSDAEVRKIAASVGRYEPAADPSVITAAVTIGDFWAYMPDHRYIFQVTGDPWPSSSVNSRVDPVPVTNAVGETKFVAANLWLDQNRPVEQMTWFPGEPPIIEGRLIDGGGWIERPGCRTLNLYRPPSIEPGDADKAGPWIEHVHAVYPHEAEHTIKWLAHRVQRPQEKLNHALALIGPQGVGKDTIIAGAIPAVGPWNVSEVGPDALMGRFNSYIKSVILRVSEARDLGDENRYKLYERTKTLIAAPPDVLRCDEKHLREYAVPNLIGVVITSNHVDGLYIPPDDRRHFVAYTELTKEDFTEDYWSDLYGWYEAGGYRHIAAYLHTLDLAGFNPKAPPPKTAGFWQVVDAGRAPEDAELADALDILGKPDPQDASGRIHPKAVTLGDLAQVADTGFGDWLKDRKNSRKIPHRMEALGYVAVRNDAAKDGKWKIGGRRQVVYARRDLTIRDRIAAASALQEASR